jgi:elongation factor P
VQQKPRRATSSNTTASYKDGDAYVFMDSEDFTQYTLDASAIGDAARVACSARKAQCH